MIFSNEKSACYYCRASGRNNFELPVVRFNFLQGEPVICERCFGERIGISAEWKKEVSNNLLDEEKEHREIIS